MSRHAGLRSAKSLFRENFFWTPSPIGANIRAVAGSNQGFEASPPLETLRFSKRNALSLPATVSLKPRFCGNVYAFYVLARSCFAFLPIVESMRIPSTSHVSSAGIFLLVRASLSSPASKMGRACPIPRAPIRMRDQAVLITCLFEDVSALSIRPDNESVLMKHGERASTHCSPPIAKEW